MRKKPLDGLPTEFIELSSYIKSYSTSSIASTVTEHDTAVMVTSHEVLVGAHLRQTYSGHRIWQHQQATDAHRKAQKLWRAAGRIGARDDGSALEDAREATEEACAITKKLSDTFRHDEVTS